jgi:hypothetical protein
MSYQLDVFTTLKQRFSTWESLQTYLTSPEGGTIRCVGEGRYRVLRYTKGISDLKTDHGKWMRSVLWDTEQHLPVCVAPPKAEKGDPQTGDNVFYPLVQPFLDGTMINVFVTKDDPTKLQITTRTQLGAGGKFYSDKTFAQMFQEALAAMNLSEEDLVRCLTSANSYTSSFASFVLQHPDHRVVARCRSPRLWLVHTGVVKNTGAIEMNESPVYSWPQHLFIHPSMNGPTQQQYVSENALSQFFADLCQKEGWFFQGLVFRDGKGKRWRMRNPNYLYLRSLRGSESTDVERFLRLRSESKVTEYLKHYSEDRQTFWDLEQKLRSKTQEVFTGYCQVHKTREKKLDELEWAIRPCVFKLHSHYLEHLRPVNEKVYMKHAVELVNNLQLFEQKRLLMPGPVAASVGGLVAAATALAVSATAAGL